MPPKRNTIVENKLKRQFDELKNENNNLRSEISKYTKVFNYEGPYSLSNLYSIAKGK